jgi:hypothetical protein
MSKPFDILDYNRTNKNNYMISLDQMREHIESLNIPQEEKDDLLLLMQPSFDFRKFLAEKLSISDAEVEALISARVASRRTELNDGLQGLDTEDYISLAVTRMSNIMREFAEENGFDQLDALQLSLEKIMLIGIRQRMATQVQNN